MEDEKYPPIELILFNTILLCILHIQIYDLFSDHVAESNGTGWLPSFRAPRPTTASRSFWLLPVLSLTGYQKFISLGQN